jgi:hypothetical protein
MPSRAMTSALETRSAVFASISNRLASWTAGVRSPTQSVTTSGMKPWHSVSTAVARTQPEVERPVIRRLSTRLRQQAGERGSEKGAWILLGQHHVPGLGAQAGRENPPADCRSRSSERGDLAAEQAAIQRVGIIDPGEDDRDARPARRGCKRNAGFQHRLDAGIKRARRVEIGHRHVDQDQRRPLAPPQRAAETGCCIIRTEIGGIAAHQITPSWRRPGDRRPRGRAAPCRSRGSGRPSAGQAS